MTWYGKGKKGKWHWELIQKYDTDSEAQFNDSVDELRMFKIKVSHGKDIAAKFDIHEANHDDAK